MSNHGMRIDAVELELFVNRFRAIAREMGAMLQRTAISTNVKERLDFSCAVLDREGELVVNAPHIPVHLGALGLCVRRLREAVSMSPGDMVITNHPRFGGSHLPDITVVAPVHTSRGVMVGYVANRAHHAEIGGSRPGSMPPDARTLEEEGVVIHPFKLIERGQARWHRIRMLLESGRFPSRAVEDNIADLRAAVASVHRGVTGLSALANAHGEPAIAHYMEALRRVAAGQMRLALREIPDGEHDAADALDDGTPLRVRFEIRGDRAVIDFEGSSGVHPGNLNATEGVVRSALIYVLRLLIGSPLPLNEGLMEPVTLRLPNGILNPDFSGDPSQAPAIVGGNVETSQRLVNLLLKALRICAGSQGTMNNVLFGTENYSYYETVCGGCGAGMNFDGASAVHSHMTNTRITDPEILELRYPVRLERFAIRRGSGGRGAYRGGEGVIREMTFLEGMELSVLSQHRRDGPFGLDGGEPGRPGAQRVIRASGEVTELGAIDGCAVGAGDRLILETPGGGGYGQSADSDSGQVVKD